MSIIDSIRGLLGGKQASTGAGFPRIYTNADWFTANKVCQPSQWNKIGEVTVPAQQLISFGANDPVGGGSIAGRSVYISIRDSTDTALHGKVRFIVTDANEMNGKVVLEENTRKLAADQNDRTKCVLLPESIYKAKQDSKLQIMFYPESGSAVTMDYDVTSNLFLVPVTVYQ